MTLFCLMIEPSLVPGPFEGRRKGRVHTVCACSIPLLKNRRGLDTSVYLYKSAYVSMFFVAGLFKGGDTT